jgi:molybdate transport repressor ModE-like protein
MDIHQLKTFVAVAREGSITRAAERVHLSQPAVSAHVKALEDTLGLALFERAARGMVLTREGKRLLEKAEQTLSAHQGLMEEATRLKGVLKGKLRLGAGSNSDHEAIGRLLVVLAERHPELEVVLRHGTSLEILEGIRSGSLDAGFYNEAGAPDPGLDTSEVSKFGIYVAGAAGVRGAEAPDWQALAGAAWIYPGASACCARTAENLFQEHGFRPQRVVSVDREDLIRTLIAGGAGVGLLHEKTAKQAESRGEVELLYRVPALVRVLFARLASRARDPLLEVAAGIIEGATPGSPAR